jgi:hypothetical protein
LEIKRLGEFIENEKRAMRSKNKYPEWKKEFLEKYLPVFSCKTVSDKVFDKFIDYAKLYNRISENNNGWINADIKEIFRAARVSVKYRNDKFLYLNDLEKTGLISFSNKNDNLNIRVNFVDMNGSFVLDIDDFRELGYEYLKYIRRGKFIRCTNCKRLVKKKSKHDYSTKYCTTCSKKIESQNALERKRKQRNIEMSRKPNAK